MWRYLSVLMITALLSICCGSQVLAVEVIAGKVVTVDRENRKIVLAPLEDGKGQVVIEFERGRIPSNLKAGELVRIKGNFTVQSDGGLESRKIWCSSPAGSGWDRTGVRSRLFEGRGMGFGGHAGGRHGGRGRR
jgi:hypothetical protein